MAEAPLRSPWVSISAPDRDKDEEAERGQDRGRERATMTGERIKCKKETD